MSSLRDGLLGLASTLKPSSGHAKPGDQGKVRGAFYTTARSGSRWPKSIGERAVLETGLITVFAGIGVAAVHTSALLSKDSTMNSIIYPGGSDCRRYVHSFLRLLEGPTMSEYDSTAAFGPESQRPAFFPAARAQV